MAITKGYCTLNEVKAAARITDNTDDTLLEKCVEAASRRIDGFTGIFFYQTTNTISLYLVDAPLVTPLSYNQYVLYTPDLVSITTLKTDDDGDGTFETTWTSGVDYRLEPTDVALQNRPYKQVTAIGAKAYPVLTAPPMPGIQINGVWGWPAVPHDVREACIIMSLRLFNRYNSPLGTLGFGDMGAVTVRSVDPDVRDMLSPYREFGIA